LPDLATHLRNVQILTGCYLCHSDSWRTYNSEVNNGFKLQGYKCELVRGTENI